MKSSTAVESTTAVKSSASAAMESTAAMAATALSECRRRRTKNHERKNGNENYRQGLLHFSPSDPTTRDHRAGTNFRRGHLRWQPNYHHILHPRRASSHFLPTQPRQEEKTKKRWRARTMRRAKARPLQTWEED
jgi:hypothetical protein